MGPVRGLLYRWCMASVEVVASAWFILNRFLMHKMMSPVKQVITIQFVQI